MKINLMIWMLAAAMLPAAAVVAEPLLKDTPTTAELRMLPPYCTTKFTKGNNPRDPEVKRWLSILGENYQHIHHYCKGINYANRANAGGRHAASYLKQSIHNYNYVLGHMTPGFVLLPELLVNRGKVLNRQNKTSEAIEDFMAAIKAKENYTPAYIALSDAYKDMGDREKARKVLEDGLQHKPNSKSLKRRLDKLGQN